MTSFQRLSIALAAFTLAMSSAAAATIDVNGVKVEDAVTVKGTSLPLNGAGTRYKAVFKVYVAALYLEKKVTTADEASALTGKKRIAVTMLRDIDANELGKLFTRGITDNAPKGDFAKLIPGLTKTGEVFASIRTLKAGDDFTIEYVPGTGTTFSVKGVQMLTPVTEPEFFNAVMRIWLGPQPADWKLKDAMLGKAA